MFAERPSFPRVRPGLSSWAGGLSGGSGGLLGGKGDPRRVPRSPPGTMLLARGEAASGWAAGTLGAWLSASGLMLSSPRLYSTWDLWSCGEIAGDLFGLFRVLSSISFSRNLNCYDLLLLLWKLKMSAELM